VWLQCFGRGIRVLDVGSGARPSVGSEQRPDGCYYVRARCVRGRARARRRRAYDEVVVGDICSPLPCIKGRFDLVLSWQVLEHVPSMRAALATQHSALVSSGHMVAMFSGAWGLHSLAVPIQGVMVRRASVMGPVGRGALG
jgi:SAM-dependent methyltransferase